MLTEQVWKITVGRYANTREPFPVADRQDIVLDADPTMDVAQQKKMGLGSFFNFKVS